MSDNASLKIWQTLQPMVRKEVASGTESSVKSKKMVVTTAYNAAAKTVGVTEAFGQEIQIPVSGSVNPDSLTVGTAVWVAALHGSWSNAIVWMLGDGSTGYKNLPRAYNLLRNGWFVSVVNQRQQTTYTGEGYGIDMWRSENTYLTVTVGSYYVKLSASGGDGKWRQYVPINESMYGKTYTAALSTNAGNKATAYGVVTADAVAQETVIASSAINTNSGSISLIKTPDGELVVEITVQDGSQLFLKWAALYEGAYTKANVPEGEPNGADDILCKKWFTRFAAYTPFSGFVNAGGTAIQFFAPMPVRMQANPTISIGTYTGIRSAAGSTAGEITAINAYTTENGLRVNATVDAKGLEGQNVTIIIGFDASAEII